MRFHNHPDPSQRERVVYGQPTGPNPLNHQDEFSRPALRHGGFNSLFQEDSVPEVCSVHAGPDPGHDTGQDTGQDTKPDKEWYRAALELVDLLLLLEYLLQN